MRQAPDAERGTRRPRVAKATLRGQWLPRACAPIQSGWAFCITEKIKEECPTTLQPVPQPQATGGPSQASEVQAAKAEGHAGDSSRALAHLGHELSTPLASIKESARLLRMAAVGPLTPEQHHVVTSIETTSEQLLRLVRNILDLSRSQLGHLELFRQPVALEALVMDVCQRLTPLFGHRTISVDVHEELPAVFADRDRLAQVFTNLLGNAVKFTDDDGHIGIRAVSCSKFAEVTITDDGYGMSVERLATLFEPFRPMHAPAAGIGTGLGLVICKELVERHGGTISVSSLERHGTTVTFSLPRFTPEGAVETFLQEILREGAPSDSTMTVCLVRLAGLADTRFSHPVIHERVEGVLRNHLRTVDRFCWVDAETALIVAATDLEGAQHIMSRFRKIRPELAPAAAGRPVELFYGLACSRYPSERTSEALLQEARANLDRMAASW